VKILKYLELPLLLFIVYFGWAIGDRNRLTFSHLTNGDGYDVIMSLLSVFLSFYTLKYLVKYLLTQAYGKLGIISRIFLGWLMVYALNLLYLCISNSFFFDRFWDNSFLYHTTPIFVAFSLFVVPYFYFLFTYMKKREEQTITLTERKIEIKTLSGKRIVVLDEVYFFKSEGKQTFVYWETIQRSLIEYTLKELEELLPKQDFFRANRQFLINRSKIKGYNNVSFQKLEVLWKDSNLSLPVVVVSKYNAAAFKSWIGSGLI